MWDLESRPADRQAPSVPLRYMERRCPPASSGTNTARSCGVSLGWTCVPMSALCRDIDSPSIRVGHNDEARSGREPGSLGRAQVGHENCNVGFEGRRRLVDECLARDGDRHVHAATVEYGGGSGHEPAFLDSVDEAGHARFVELKEFRQLVDSRRPVSEDPKQPGLDDGQVVRGGQASECTLYDKGELSQ
jgi:hypothetical protein